MAAEQRLESVGAGGLSREDTPSWARVGPRQAEPRQAEPRQADAEAKRETPQAAGRSRRWA